MTTPGALNASVNFLAASNQSGCLKENTSFVSTANASQLRLNESQNDTKQKVTSILNFLFSIHYKESY